MKVIAINGSPHTSGAVHKGLTTMAAELEKEGIAVEFVHAGKGVIRGCIDCRKCRELQRCVFDDDLVNQTREKVNEADGLIIGSPVYYGGIAGTFKSFLDRLFFPGLNIKHKAAAAVVSLRRSGGIATFHQLNNYLNLAQAVITPTQYWAVIHGNDSEEVSRDGEGMQIMRTAGRNMAWLIKVLAAGKKAFPLPEAEQFVRTNFIR
jgi:multimeric flavodoxin WrbA